MEIRRPLVAENETGSGVIRPGSPRRLMALGSATRASPTAGRASIDDEHRRRALLRVRAAAHRLVLARTLAHPRRDVKPRRLPAPCMVMVDSRIHAACHAARRAREARRRGARRCDVSRGDPGLSQPRIATSGGSRPAGARCDAAICRGFRGAAGVCQSTARAGAACTWARRYRAQRRHDARRRSRSAAAISCAGSVSSDATTSTAPSSAATRGMP